MKKKRTEAQLKKVIFEARKELNDIEVKRMEKELSKCIGNFYRYRNCFSCPKTESDYWCIYRMVLRMEDHHLVCLDFQKGSKGEWRIENTGFSMGLDGWEEIEASEFDAAWNVMMEELKSYY